MTFSNLLLFVCSTLSRVVEITESIDFTIHYFYGSLQSQLQREFFMNLNISFQYNFTRKKI